MSLALRQFTWLDGTIVADDYDVIHDSEIAGRVYRMKADRELWRWTLRLQTPVGGIADTLDEAKAALRRVGGAPERLGQGTPPATDAGDNSRDSGLVQQAIAQAI